MKSKKENNSEHITAKEYPEVVSEANKKHYICIDVRTPAEYNHLKVVGTRNIPLDEIEEHVDFLKKYHKIYINCGSGARSEMACKILKEKGLDNLVNVEGGIEACQDCEGAVIQKAGAVLPLLRQVFVVASMMVLAGLGLGYFVNSWFFLLDLMVGCGLLFSGVTGICPMSIIMGKMPWNK